MTVTIHLVGQLKSIFNNQSIISVEAGQTVREFLITAHVMPEMVAGVVVNGDLQSKDYVLQDADDVKLIAVMSGG
jgi:sulfur carrier protein ThiS